MFDFHTPVLLNEIVEYLNIKKGKKYIDATIGGGGHTAAILHRGGIVLGIDIDADAIGYTKKHFAAELKIKSLPAQAGENLKIVQGNFKDIDVIAREHGFDKVDGILFDLGMSSWQIEKSGRGFSFQKDELLDMRADPNLKVTAADLINGLTTKELYELFTKFGEEKFSRRIAECVTKRRRVAPIKTTKQLADIVSEVYANVRGYQRGRTRIHPATRVFQALRIAVNDELRNLRDALPKTINLLVPDGRLVVISFHSLEDRIVKDFMRMYANEDESGVNKLRILTNKPVRPTAEEIEKNPRARAAKMRTAVKL